MSDFETKLRKYQGSDQYELWPAEKKSNKAFYLMLAVVAVVIIVLFAI